MITPAYVQTMAAYNAEMNRRIYSAAARLAQAQRHEHRGAFWGSLHGTLSHLVWGDRQWMSRFAGWPKPTETIKQSATLHPDFVELHAARTVLDADLTAWADTVTQPWLDQDLVWISGAVGREMRKPRTLLLAHMFNHQTHHRGQAHTLLTQLGQPTEDTDLPFILP